MARDHARITTSIASDDDFCALSEGAQAFYWHLCAHGTLNYAGVADWRPKRLAKLCRSWSPDRIEELGAELSAASYIVIDDETEEVLVRSFIRSDGILKQPNIAIAMAAAYSSVASPLLRGVIVHELRRLWEDFPDMASWGGKASGETLRKILKNPSVDPSSLIPGNPSNHPSPDPSDDPPGKGQLKGQGNPSVKGQPPTPTPSPTPIPNSFGAATSSNGPADASQQAAPPESDDALFAPELGGAARLAVDDPPDASSPADGGGEREASPGNHRSRGRRITEDWTPSAGLDAELRLRFSRPDAWWDFHLEQFVDYWVAKSGKDACKTDWDRTWRIWVKKEAAKGFIGGVPGQRQTHHVDHSAPRSYTAPAHDPIADRIAQKRAQHEKEAS